MHVDIQGAEYDVVPPNMPLLKKNVKRLMVGTHLANEKHDDLVKLLETEGWQPR